MFSEHLQTGIRCKNSRRHTKQQHQDRGCSTVDGSQSEGCDAGPIDMAEELLVEGFEEFKWDRSRNRSRNKDMTSLGRRLFQLDHWIGCTRNLSAVDRQWP